MRFSASTLFLAILAFLALIGLIASASITVDPGTGQVSANYTVGIEYNGTGQAAPSGSFSTDISLASTGEARAAPGSPSSASTGVSWGGLVRYYKNESGNLTLAGKEQLGPGISDGYVVRTQTITRTITKTITRTLPGGTSVQTIVQTVTIAQQRHPRAALLGLGAIALLLFLLARR